MLSAAGLGAGLLVAASLPPFGWWPLALLGAALLAGLLRDRPWTRRLLIGMAAGLGSFGPGLWWILDFSGPGYVAATIVEAAIVALAMVAVPPGRGRLLAFPGALVLAGAVAGHWPFGGVPLAGIPLGQAAGPLAPAARLGGHLLLTALVGVSGASLAALAEWTRDRRRARPARPLKAAAGALAGLAAVVAVAAAGAAATLGGNEGTVRVAAVQGGGQRGLRAISVDSEIVLAAQVAATTAVRPPVDLVVWPEDVVDVDGALAGSSEERLVADVARATGATVVAGIVEDVGADRFRNAAVAWAPDGSRVARYDKVRRVPFGEYIPFRTLIDRVADISAVPRDALEGRGPGILRTPVGPLGVVISYEVFFADRARAAVRAGGQLLLVPTNASSFTTSHVPTQELAAARLRALETGRTVVQAAPTGFSAVVDPNGRVVARTALGPAAVVQRTVTLRDGQTLFTRLGDGPVTGAAAVALATGALLYRRSKKT
ncbi:MAG TPA: apolipoprotein N-acyltransferase [Acidimicrobiales bacterium]|nr:apolipoprotein N-acyltransferase [Acidimicrobiales bacterium]